MARTRTTTQYAEADDCFLVERAKGGDREAFAELYRRHHPALLRQARARLADAADAEEVTQEVFIKAFLAIDRLDPKKPVRPWLATIAGNYIIDLHRTRTPCISLDPEDEDLHPAPSDLTWEAVLAAERLRVLKAAIAELPERQRRILLAAVFDDISQAELAVVEKVSEVSVTSAVYRARVAIKGQLRRLVVVVLPLRVLWRRGKDRVGRAMPLARQVSSMGDLAAATCCWSVAAVAAAVFALPPSVISHQPVNNTATRHIRSIGSLAIDNARSSRDTSSDQLSPKPSSANPPLRTSVKTGPPNHGPAPSSGSTRIEVYGPDGQPVFGTENDFQCNDVGIHVLPQSGPVRAAC